MFRLPLAGLVNCVPRPSVFGSAPCSPIATSLSSIQTSVSFLLVHDRAKVTSVVDAPQAGGVKDRVRRVAGPRGGPDVRLVGAELERVVGAADVGARVVTL